ncbi:hypothetical protein RF11_14893 [Thelohanellus kitauei]|uniref:Uncharacterized protein n=1 Tax=Thelohanellus kitauei TaxID=669202 RepID=A0A0C2MWF5_THEKT|nr:hypothetical protein RF11_14893 [Thelohanellus kitauei]
MSEQTQVAQVENKPYQPKSEDLVKKLLHIPGICDYHVIMKQSKESRFFCITEMKESARKNRIIVPMDHCLEFLAKLYDVLKFGSEYPSKAPAKAGNEDSRFAFTVSMHTEAGRRYYFDVIDNESVLNLKMSYIYDDRRDSILIDLGSLVAFVGVIEMFQKDYPSITGKDDFHPHRNRRFDKRRGSPRRGSRFNNRGFYNRDSAQSSTRPRQNYNFRPNFEESAERKKSHALKVCSDPAPYQFTNNAKKYMFEIVEGDNTFMRITEAIGDSRKSTLHVPIDCLKQVQSVLAEMNDRFSAARSADATAVKS